MSRLPIQPTSISTPTGAMSSGDAPIIESDLWQQYNELRGLVGFIDHYNQARPDQGIEAPATLNI